jgi:formamidopyrimidine-DNA glycosylase
VPELPDVEVFRRYLLATSRNRTVSRVQVFDETLLRGITKQRLARALTRHEIVGARRHGKHLFVAMAGAAWLVLHFGMTGHLEHGSAHEPVPEHTRMALLFIDGTRLCQVDMRRLGFATLTEDPDEYVAAVDLGPDALAVTERELRSRLESRRGTVKSALMDQSLVAGIGNIYADEILFQAQIDPQAPAAELGGASYRRLHRQMGRVLRMAADRDADPRRMPRTWLLPHREDGAPCPRRNGTIRKYRSAGRAGYYCPACQTAGQAAKAG